MLCLLRRRAALASLATPATFSRRALSSSAQDWIDDEYKGRALIFGKTWCGFSQMAQGMLELAGAEHLTVVQLDLRDDGDAIQQELLELTGQRTVPSIWIDGHFVGGYSELSRLSEDELHGMLEKAGARE